MHFSTRRLAQAASIALGCTALLAAAACVGSLSGDGPGGDDSGTPDAAGNRDSGPPSAADAASASRDGLAAIDSPPPRGPTPATASAAFPFPQNREATGSVYPAGYLNSDVQTAYAKWKADLVTASGADGHRRVQRTASDGIDLCRPLHSTVSEGIGYGMLIAVYMNDQSLFDDLWLYEEEPQNLDPNGLMNWAPDGTDMTCLGGATDADEDMAFALVMADRQWGGQGSLPQTYEQAAITQIQKVWDKEIYGYSWLQAGDGAWATNANQNISYFAPAYYRVFAQIDPKTCPQGSDVAYATTNACDRWWGVIDQSYATMGDALNPTNGNQANGLVPGWCDDSQGAPCRLATGEPFTYQYDACRTPFRIGLDWSWNGEAAAHSYVASISAFFTGIGASHIVDGYALDGTPQPANPGKLSAAFIGPATVAAMCSAGYQQLVDDGYAEVAKDTAFAGGEYYESSWTVMSLLMLTGNFLDYTQETPAQ
jgi:endo-1,4-beta-D-glucanase Y